MIVLPLKVEGAILAFRRRWFDHEVVAQKHRRSERSTVSISLDLRASEQRGSRALCCRLHILRLMRMDPRLTFSINSTIRARPEAPPPRASKQLSLPIDLLAFRSLFIPCREVLADTKSAIYHAATSIIRTGQDSHIQPRLLSPLIASSHLPTKGPFYFLRLRLYLAVLESLFELSPDAEQRHGFVPSVEAMSGHRNTSAPLR